MLCRYTLTESVDTLNILSTSKAAYPAINSFTTATSSSDPRVYLAPLETHWPAPESVTTSCFVSLQEQSTIAIAIAKKIAFLSF